MSEKKEVPSGIIEPAQKVGGMRVTPHAERTHDEALVQLVKTQVAKENAKSVSAKEEIADLIAKGKESAHNPHVNPSQFHPPPKNVEHANTGAGFAINQPRK